MYASRKGIKILLTKTKTSRISKLRAKYGNGGEMIWQILQFNAGIFIPIYLSKTDYIKNYK